MENGMSPEGQVSGRDRLKEALRLYLEQHTTASVSTQEALYSGLVKALEPAEATSVPEAVIKFLVRTAVGVYIDRYTHRQSRRLVESLFNSLHQRDSAKTHEHLSQSIARSRSLSVKAAVCASWLVDSLRKSSTSASRTLPTTDTVVALARTAYHALYSVRGQRLLAPQMLKLLKLQMFGDDQLPAVLERLEAVEVVALLTALSLSLGDGGEGGGGGGDGAVWEEKLASAWLESYSKCALSAKIPIPAHLAASKRLISHLNAEQLNTFHSAAKKALLREPEVAIQGVTNFLKGMPSGRDALCEEFLVAIMACLTSTNEEISQLSLQACSYIARAISSGDVMNSALSKVVAYIKESQAKSTPSQKAALWKCVELLSANSLSESEQQSTCDALCKQASQLALGEGNDSVGAAVWSAIEAWAVKCESLSTVASTLLEKCTTIKPTGVRQAAMRAAAEVYSQLGTAVVLPAELVRTATALLKKVPAPVSNESMELIPLAVLISQAARRGQPTGKGIVEVIRAHPLFVKEKFITALTTKDALLIPTLIRSLQYGTHVKLTGDAFGTLLASSLFWPHYAVRKRGIALVKEIASCDVGDCCDLLKCLLDGFQSGLFDQIYSRLMSASIDVSTAEQAHKLPVPKWSACQVVESLLPSSIPPTSADRGQLITLVVNTLFTCSLERIVEHNGALWIHWITAHKEWAEPLLQSAEFCDAIVERLYSPQSDLVICANVVRLLVSVGELGTHVSGAFWRRCSEDIRALDVQLYTSIDQHRVDIYHTPEGTLHNTSVIEMSFDEGGAKNVRRENKAYSYKEQLAEIQLRKELAEKQRKEGKLTAKQQKAVEEELKAEAKIRADMRKLYEVAERKLLLLGVAAKYSPKHAFEHIGLLFDVVVPLLKSRLLAEPAAGVFLAFRDAFFEPSDNHIHDLSAHASLRVLESRHLYAEWCDEPLERQLRRLFALLSSTCMMFKLGGAFGMAKVDPEDEEEEVYHFDEAEEELEMERMTAAKLAFLLPLLERIYADGGKKELTPVDHLVTSLRVTATAFLKDALCSSFVTPEEAGSLPILRLGGLLLRVCASSAGTADYIDNLFTVLASLFALLADFAVVEDSESAAEVERFILDTGEYFFADDPTVRRCTLEGFHRMKNLLVQLCLMQSGFKAKLEKVVFLARRDPDADCSTLASVIWDELHLKTAAQMYSQLIDERSLVSPDNKLLRKEACQCIHDLLDEYPASLSAALESLTSAYHQYKEVLPAQHDAVGRLLKAEVDRWEVRSSIANTVLLLAEIADQSLLMELMRGVVEEGLGDRNEHCRALMLNAGVTAIKRHGTAKLDELLPFLEKRLDETPPGGEFDNLRTGLIVLIGTLAKHMDPKRSEDKIRKIVARLIESLSTPSQQVQESVAACLPDLVPVLRSDARELVHSMMSLLAHSDSYGERRGAAYGVAAIVKGLGIVTIKELEIIPTLKGMLGQSSGRAKESALLCVEMLCGTIGKLFEPYSVQLLPDLLKAFGDQGESVRRAADDAARAMMKALSAHGLKLVLPSLLKVLGEDEKWRTKCAATEMLGAMAHCAPRQLSACLPKIVPRLCDVLTDSHAKVQKSGEKALKQIAQVIRSPEFLSISSHLVAALMDPAVKTKAALEIVVNTRFVHFVDSPSLALLIPIVSRSFGDRNMDTKRMGANIIANLYALADHKEIAEYLSILVPGVRKLLVDPEPEVRTMASKALGAIIRHSPPTESERLQADIIPWLKECLVSKNSAVDRSGAAQGMCEIIAALGDEFLKSNMPTVIRITESSSTEAHIRDGYLLLYIYLPSTLGEHFLPYIPLIVPSILRALADETEYVRDSAMKAAQRLITVYGHHAKRLLLPQLLAAVIHENWRIRHASVQLLGEWLFQIGGISGKMTSDTAGEDETLGIETVNKAIVRSIGQESRDEILASLYLTRHDVSLLVRQTSSHIWKVVVGNTQRTVKELLPSLFELILHCIASEHEDTQQMAQRCLAEMTKKMGEKIIATVLPLLEKRLQPKPDGDHGVAASGDVESRRQVAVAINELISNATREAIENSSPMLIPPVKACLSDSDELVRNYASTAFISLYQIIGPSAVDEVVLAMLDDFSSNGNHDALSGLCLVVAKGRGLLASLMPRITKPPINSTALCQLAAANPESLSRNLPKILEALLCPVENLGCSLEEHVGNVADCLSSISDEDGVMSIVGTLLKKSSTSIVASTILRQYVLAARVGLECVAEPLLQGLLPLYDSADECTVANSVETLNALVKGLNSDQLLELVMTLKRATGQLYSSHEDKRTGSVETVSALRRADGWKALLAISREGLLAGTMEAKELAGIAMTQLIAMSTESGLKPYAVNMAGPFIRVLGDRQPPPHVKIAILSALLKLLDKVPNILRPFLPQMKSMLQRIQSEESASSPTLSKLAEQGTQRLAALYG